MPTPADSTLASMAPMPEAMAWMNARGAEKLGFSEIERSDESGRPSKDVISPPNEDPNIEVASDATTVQPVIVPSAIELSASAHPEPPQPSEVDESSESLNVSSADGAAEPEQTMPTSAKSRPRTVEKTVDPALLLESMGNNDSDEEISPVVFIDPANELTDAVVLGLRTVADPSELEAHQRVPQFIEWYVQQAKSKSEPSLIVADHALEEMSGLELVFCIRAIETAMDSPTVPIILFVDKRDRAQLDVESTGLEQVRLISRGPRQNRLAHAERIVNVVSRILS